MKYSFFTIPVRDPGQAQDELNSFLTQHRVVSVVKEFINNGANSCWSLCVEWVDKKDSLTPASGAKRKQVDYKELLSEADFAIYLQLRSLRKKISEEAGVPPYVVFTNEQLAEIVRQHISSKSVLSKLKGVGIKRVETYGEPFLNLMKENLPKPESSETDTH